MGWIVNRRQGEAEGHKLGWMVNRRQRGTKGMAKGH